MNTPQDETQDEGKAELLQRVSELPREDQLLVLAMGTALTDRSAGRMSAADAATFEAVKDQEPYNLEAIEGWLADHGYLAKVLEQFA